MQEKVELIRLIIRDRPLLRLLAKRNATDDLEVLLKMGNAKTLLFDGRVAFFNRLIALFDDLITLLQKRNPGLLVLRILAL